MDISKLNNFIEKLNYSSHYITTNSSGAFGLTADKSLKVLNTQAIGLLASAAFQSIAKEEASPLKQKQLYHSLKSALQKYSAKTIKSKPWWGRLLAFLGIVSKAERSIRQTIENIQKSVQDLGVVFDWGDPKKKSEELLQKYKNKINKQVTKKIGNYFEQLPLDKNTKDCLPLYDPCDLKRICDQITSKMRPHLHEKMENDQLKRFYGKVLGNSPFESKELNGYSLAYGLHSYIKDLKKYRRHLVSKNQSVSNNLSQIIEELSYAYNLALLQRQTKEEINKNLLNDIRKKIIELPISKNGNGPCILLPGHVERHSFMFKIQKELDGFFSLTLINGGEGCILFRKFFTFQNKNYTKDFKYNGLTTDDISLSFVANIIKCYDNKTLKSTYPDMNSLLEMVKTTFYKKTLTYGRSHSIQTKGVCCFKSTSLTIHERLGDKEYRPFKVFVTKREIKRLKKLKKEMTQNQEALSQMLAEGEKVLQKRKNRLFA